MHGCIQWGSEGLCGPVRCQHCLMCMALLALQRRKGRGAEGALVAEFVSKGARVLAEEAAAAGAGAVALERMSEGPKGIPSPFPQRKDHGHYHQEYSDYFVLQIILLLSSDNGGSNDNDKV